ncbi:MAG: response regulator [Nitrospinae bacterium]|nr:response regulator [Nitrospinota bacterium]
MFPQKILVVDDDEPLRFALSLSLKMSGFRLETAGNGREALDKILSAIEGKSPFDLLITDIIMPEMNGLELVERLSHAGVKIPVLVMSAHARGAKIFCPLPRKGIACFLEKPFNMEEMIHSVNLLLKNADTPVTI